MKVKSVSGVVLNVQDVRKSARFYEGLGLEARRREAEQVTVYSNWFWIELRQAAGKGSTPNGSGPSLWLSVDDVDKSHKDLQAKGVKAMKEPFDADGNRVLEVQDPDGYSLVLFKKK